LSFSLCILAFVLFLIAAPTGWCAEPEPMPPPAQSNNAAVAPGDTLFVEVYRRPELSTTAQVDANGSIAVPYVGNVHVAGVSEKEAGEGVQNALRTILKNPRVTVSRSAIARPGAARTAEMKTQVINLNNGNAEVLSKTLHGMNSAGGNVSADPNTNSVIVTDTPATIQNMMAVIGQLDQMQSQITQVRIESKVAEVEQGAMKQLGVRWFTKSNNITGGFYPPAQQLLGGGQAPDNEHIGTSTGFGNSTARRFVDDANFDRRLQVPIQVPTPGQMFFGMLTHGVDIGTMIDALVQDNKAEVLASPMILAVNHKQAEIKMADEFPYTEASQAYGGTAYNVKFMDLGIKLKVTPHVYKDSTGPYVQLDLTPEISFAAGMSNGVPVRSVRSSNSIANVRDGQTLVIGGIVLNDERNVSQGVPGVSKIPLVGNLFKRKEKSRSRNELMIFVTPTIHEAPESVTWDRMINVTGAAKPDMPAIPVNETQGERRKD
jgi:type II secretory pathway component GspD/PulD (secretin)